MWRTKLKRSELGIYQFRYASNWRWNGTRTRSNAWHRAMDSKSGNKQEPIDARAIELKPIAVSACMPRFIVMNYALLLLPSTWPIQPTICIRARNLPGHSRWPIMLASCLWSVEATIYIIPLLWNIFPCVCVCVYVFVCASSAVLFN